MLKVAVIGTGSMALIYLDLLKERNDVDLVAVVGNSEDKTNQVAQKYGITGISNGDVPKLMKVHNINAVVLATPEWIRLEPLSHLKDHDIKILIEKPLATSPEDLAKIDSFFNGKTADISVAHSLRLSPRFSQAKLQLEQKSIGEIRHIYARRNPNLKSVQRVIGKFDLVYWMICHDLDLMRWMLDDEVEYVQAITRNKLKSEDDYLLIHLHFKSGVDAIEEVSWCSPPTSNSLDSCYFNLKGTEGVLEIEDSQMNTKIYKGNNVVEAPDTYEHFLVSGNHYGIFHQVIDHWVKSVVKGQKSIINYENAKKAVELCTHVRKSIDSGERVYVE